MVAELFLSAFLQVLFDRLASRELLKFAFQEGVGSKLKKWRKTLKMIEAVLNDAEEKQLTDTAVKLWLDDLKDLAYDVEDILDEFATDALGRKFVAEDQASTNTSKVRSFIRDKINTLSPSALKSNVSMRSKIKDITRRMEDLCKQRTDLGLEKIAGRSSFAGPERLPSSTCLPIEPAIFGRDEDKAGIIKKMSTAESSEANFLVIPIVGMGGLGKTTLARFVYNDKALEDFKFETKAWVCVSDGFDILRISKAILESITLSPCDLKDLNQVQLQLKRAIAEKKFLLVLDDVWNTNYGLWETLKSPFMAGASGSKIIVTTRNESVASMVAPGGEYKLNLLSDDNCWSIFMKHAFQGRDIAACKNLELIREKVVEKCKGLPLAARTLGGLLRSKKRYDDWNDILNSKIWDLPDENEILPVLKLSYHHLPAHTKTCFAYCSILPKGYEFEEKEVVLLWMAEGLIQESKDHKQLEDLGCAYFADLVARSIFQKSSAHNSKFIMHDLVSELAQWVSGETSFRMEDGMGANKQRQNVERVRHFSYTSKPFDGIKKFEDFHELKQLRTFHPFVLRYNDIFDHYYITNLVLTDLLLKFKKLRVLSLRRYYITRIPDSIGELKHLRYLNFSYTKIKYLPKSTSSLFNLQSLLLRECSCLMKLPNMEHLINLRHLDIGGVNKIKEMPLGIKELRCLQTLSNFIVSKNVGSNLKDLKDLKFLTEELCISGLKNVVNSRDIGQAILSGKKGLKVLSLEWGSHVEDSRDEIEEESVLNMLQPQENIEEFTVKGYCGKKFPSWIGDSSLSNMVVLRLESCVNCTFLPSLGKLRSLKDLTIKRMTKIISIGFEVYGESNLKPFQSLETLFFEDLPEWKLWEQLKESEDAGIFPCLRKLSIVKCPKLTGKLPENLPSLEELVIHECPRLLVPSSRNLPSHVNLQRDACKETMGSNLIDCNSLNSVTPEKISEFGNWIKQACQKVERLRIMDCEKLICLWQNEISLEKPPQGWQSCSSLKTLLIQDCSTLVSFPEIGLFPSLCELEIKNCNVLTFLPVGMWHGNTNLESLRIQGCHSLTFIIKGQLPPSLKRLSIYNCEKLQILFDDTEDISPPSSSMMQNAFISNTRTSALERLLIFNCPSLTALSLKGQLPVSLTLLVIHKCLKLGSIVERFDSNISLRSLEVRGCENLSSLPQGLYNLNHLHEIELAACSNLVCFPEGGLPNTILDVSIFGCEKLRELPEGFHNLSCLQDLTIIDCPSIKSFAAEGFLSNLRSLTVYDNLEIYKTLKEWELHRLTCLTRLEIGGFPDVVSFPEDEMGMMLPTSLIELYIEEFPNLKCLSFRGFQDLASLEKLWISNCPQLSSFPGGLTSSLLRLCIYDCPLLLKQFKRDKGREWPKIANIPCVEIDGKFIYDSEED